MVSCTQNGQLPRVLNPQLLHAVDQGRPVQAEQFGRAVRSADFAPRFFQRLQDVISFHVLQLHVPMIRR